MAGLAATLPTLVDVAKVTDPDGKIAAVAEMLAQSNPVLLDMPWQEGNLATGHRVSVRTGLPTATWRLLNRGVANSKATAAQIDEGCGMLEARSQVDKDLCELNGNSGAFRLSESHAFLEAMNIEMAQTLFYGNVGADPEEFTGLAPRFNSLSAANATNVVNGAGAGGDNSSIWLTVWGPHSLFGIYPKGSTAGLKHDDLGLGDAFDSSNNRFRAYMDHYQWKCGIALKDWRYTVRIDNIDISALIAKSSAADLIELMIKAIHRIPNGYAGFAMGKPVFYMNRTCFQMLDIQRYDNVMAGGGINYKDVDGILTPNFRGIPIRVCDALTEAEAAVV